MTARAGRTRGLPAVVLVARREVRMRLRSRVFVGGTIVMTALVVIGIVAASLLAGKTTPVQVGFSAGSQALERTFSASAAALGATVTVSDIGDVTAGKARVTAGTLDVLVTGTIRVQPLVGHPGPGQELPNPKRLRRELRPDHPDSRRGPRQQQGAASDKGSQDGVAQLRLACHQLPQPVSGDHDDLARFDKPVRTQTPAARSAC